MSAKGKVNKNFSDLFSNKTFSMVVMTFFWKRNFLLQTLCAIFAAYSHHLYNIVKHEPRTFYRTPFVLCPQRREAHLEAG